jgi:hypothetical protein
MAGVADALGGAGKGSRVLGAVGGLVVGGVQGVREAGVDAHADPHPPPHNEPGALGHRQEWLFAMLGPRLREGHGHNQRRRLQELVGMWMPPLQQRWCA